MAIFVKASKLYLRKKPENKTGDGTAVTNGLEAYPDLFINMPFRTPDLIDVNKRLIQGVADAKSGDKIIIAGLKKVNIEWMEKFGLTTDAVSLLANGNDAIILKAGMTPTSSTSRKKQKPEQTNIQAKPGKGKGTCAVTADRQKSVNGYIVVAADDSVKMTMNGDVLEMNVNGTPIFLKAGTRRTMQLDGLPSVKELCVTMFTFNSAGCSPLSNSEEMVPQ